jgi:Ca2+-binding EF-hand superfamily protein
VTIDQEILVTSQAIKTKAQQLFDTLDRTGNGTISADDFKTTADRIISTFGAVGTPKAQTLQSTYQQVWCDLADKSDSDRNGEVTRQEFETVFADTGLSGSMGPIEAAIQAEFDVADIDNDGVLSNDELARMLASVGVDSSEADEAARALDRDGDGQVSRQEYISAMREFYVDPNLNGPAAKLLGSLN